MRASAGAAGGGVTLAAQRDQGLLGAAAAVLGSLASLLGGRALALQLVPFRCELQQVGLGPLGGPGDRGAGVLEGGDPSHEAHLRVAGALLPSLGVGLSGRALGEGALGGVGLFLGGGELVAQRAFLAPARLEGLEEGADPALELLRLQARFRGAGVRLGDLLLAVAGLRLVPIHGEGQLVQATAGLLEARLVLVEGGAPRLHPGFLGLEGDVGGLFALSLGEEALAQGPECDSRSRKRRP